MTSNCRINKLRSVFVMLALARASLADQTTSTGVSVATPSPLAPVSSAGLVNDCLREQIPWFEPFDLGGQFRARFVEQTYFAVPGAGPTAVDFRASTPENANDFLLLRTRFHLGYSPTDWLTMFGEGQNSSSTGDKRNPNPQSDGPFDLYQGYVRLGGTKDLPLSLKVGRQELAYGDERLVGVSDWDNMGRVFD